MELITILIMLLTVILMLTSFFMDLSESDEIIRHIAITMGCILSCVLAFVVNDYSMGFNSFIWLFNSIAWGLMLKNKIG